jgi:hypothetical protein
MNVAAGHGNVKIMEGFVVKKAHNVEVLFFTKLKELQNNNPELLKIMPKVLDIENNKVKMTMVGQNLKLPKICDVKIGFKTFSRQEYLLNRHDENKKKKFKMEILDLVKGSGINGFRIEGISHERRRFVYNDYRNTLKNFLGKNQSVYKSVISQLNDIKNIMMKQDFAFIGSSVLLAVDEDKKNVEVKLIDFAHPFYKSNDEKTFEKIQASFLGGLDNLIDVIESIKDKKFPTFIGYKKPKEYERTDESTYNSDNSDNTDNSYNSNVIDMDWNYRPDDFTPKLNKDGTPDIEKQNEANARIWYHTIYSNINSKNPGYNAECENKLKEQQNILLRNICALFVCEPMEGNQLKWDYRFDDKHSIAQYISSGGRFGYVFEDENTGKKFINQLITGDENKNYKVAIENDIIYRRLSTHSQKFNGHFIEVKNFATPVKENTYGMNFPIGGVGNFIESNGKKTLVGYNGEALGGKYQLGSMLIKFDTQSGKARLMCGFESTAPNRKNQFGGKHGLFSTISKNFRRFLQKIVRDLKLPINVDKFYSKKRSLTGQNKGNAIGIFKSYGSNIAIVTESKLEKFQELYKALCEMNIEVQKSFVKSILISRSRGERGNIYRDIIAHKSKKEADKNKRTTLANDALTNIKNSKDKATIAMIRRKTIDSNNKLQDKLFVKNKSKASSFEI